MQGLDPYTDVATVAGWQATIGAMVARLVLPRNVSIGIGHGSEEITLEVEAQPRWLLED